MHMVWPSSDGKRNSTKAAHFAADVLEYPWQVLFEYFRSIFFHMKCYVNQYLCEAVSHFFSCAPAGRVWMVVFSFGGVAPA